MAEKTFPDCPVIVPKATSLKRYSLTQEEWVEYVKQHNYVCPICLRLPKNKRLVTDHWHCPGFKKLPKNSKDRYNCWRGNICAKCNMTLLPTWMTLERARNIVKYLEAYEKKKQENLAKTMPTSLLDKPGNNQE